MEVVSGDNWTTGAISRAKLQSNHHHQQTNQTVWQLQVYSVTIYEAQVYTFYSCFDTVGWVTGIASGLQKKFTPADPGDALLANCREPSLTCGKKIMSNLQENRLVTPHAKLSGAVYCYRSCLWVCLCVCGSVTTITRNCVHRSSPNSVCRWR